MAQSSRTCKMVVSCRSITGTYHRCLFLIDELMLIEGRNMPISLNNKDKSISYDNRIDYYIDLNRFAAELVFSFELPVLLPHISECYCIDTSSESYEIELFKSPRKIIVAGTRNWITTNSDVKIKDLQCGSTNFYTSFVIACEVKKDEIKDVIDVFSTSSIEELVDFQNTLLQNVLEVVIYRYNEKAGGKSFLTPSYKDCKNIFLQFYINHIAKKQLRCAFEDYNWEILNDNENPIRDEEFANDISNWRYFYNKCKFELSRCNYIDSIISAAVSVESYAWHIIRLNYAEDKVDDFSKGDDGEHLSATALYKKIFDYGWLTSSLSKSKMSSKIQKILSPRNSIMHGEKSINTSWKSKAEQLFNTLSSLYIDFGEIVDEGLFLDDIEHNSNYYIYKDFVYKCNNGFQSPETMKEESLEMINKMPELILPRIQYVKSLFALDEVELAKIEMGKVIDYTDDKGEVLLALYSSLIEKIGIEETIIMFENVEGKNERICAALAELYVKKYKRDKKDETIIPIILDWLNMAKRISSKYLVPAYVEHNLYIEMENEEEKEKEYILKKFIADCVTQDYFMPLLVASHYIKENNSGQVLKYFELFVERFRACSHVGLLLDFMCIKCDIDQVKKISQLVLEYLIKCNMSVSITEEDLDKLLCKKMDGLCSIDNYINHDKGEMPIQNLFYRERIMIPGGYLLLK